MRTRGRGLKKEIWFSICSRHAIYDERCDICNKGSWRNAIKHEISSFIYKKFPNLWEFFINLTFKKIKNMKKIKNLIILLISLYPFILNGQDSLIKKDLSQIEIITHNPYQSSIYYPLSFKNINKDYISVKNYGQEPSRILSNSPSMITHTESGSDWGYSYIRMRGLDHTRINVTLNGIPMNEPEDQGCYFSNYPDLLQSVSSIQIQRGVGMTKNGTSNYGGSINFESFIPDTTLTSLNIGFGSYNTFRLSLNTSQKWKNGGIYISSSNIRTDGYKYNSGNESKSNFLSFNQKLGKNELKIISFYGNQKNELSWIGVPINLIEKDRKINNNSSNEIDDFTQFHLQIHNNYNIKKYNILSYKFYYNHLNGFYTYNYNQLNGISLNSDFIGGNINYYKKYNNLDLYNGINISYYNREHSDYTKFTNKTYKNIGYRNDLSAFIKAIYEKNNINFYSDIQFRKTNFIYDDSNVKGIIFDYGFLNYIFGVSYKKDNNILYYSIGESNKEPNRTDIFFGNDHLSYDVAILNKLKPENVSNQEIGYRYRNNKFNLNINYFYMSFNNELVLTGDYGINSIPIHINVDKSIRKGIELNFDYIFENIKISNNFSYNKSEIKIKDSLTYESILTPKYIYSLDLTYKNKLILIGVNYKYQNYMYIDITNENKIPSYYNLNLIIGIFYKNLELFTNFNNITNNKYLTYGMKGYDNDILYFVGPEFNIFTGLKIKF